MLPRHLEYLQLHGKYHILARTETVGNAPDVLGKEDAGEAEYEPMLLSWLDLLAGM